MKSTNNGFFLYSIYRFVWQQASQLAGNRWQDRDENREIFSKYLEHTDSTQACIYILYNWNIYIFRIKLSTVWSNRIKNDLRVRICMWCINMCNVFEDVSRRQKERERERDRAKLEYSISIRWWYSVLNNNWIVGLFSPALVPHAYIWLSLDLSLSTTLLHFVASHLMWCLCFPYMRPRATMHLI